MNHPKRYMADGTATTTRVRGVAKREACPIHPRGCYAVLTSWAGDPIARPREWHAYLLTQSTGVGLLDTSGVLDREMPQFKAGIRRRVLNAEKRLT